MDVSEFYCTPSRDMHLNMNRHECTQLYYAEWNENNKFRGMTLGHAKLISYFWSYKSLKNDQASRLFSFILIFFGNQS